MKTNLSNQKTVTGYKVVYKINGNFVSCFMGVPYKTGKVPIYSIDDVIEYSTFFQPHSNLHFNVPMHIGRIIAFPKLQDARALYDHLNFCARIKYNRLCIVKVILSGKLTVDNNGWKQTVGHDIGYFGTVLKSMKEIEIK